MTSEKTRYFLEIRYCSRCWTWGEGDNGSARARGEHKQLEMSVAKIRWSEPRRGSLRKTGAMTTSQSLEDLVWGLGRSFLRGSTGTGPMEGRNPHPQPGDALSKATAGLASGQQPCSTQDAGLENSRRSFQPTFVPCHELSPV